MFLPTAFVLTSCFSEVRITVSYQVNGIAITKRVWMFRYNYHQAASSKKKSRGVAVKRASIPGLLPAIFPISILDLHSAGLFCFMCLEINTDNTRGSRLSRIEIQISSDFMTLKFVKNRSEMGLQFFFSSFRQTCVKTLEYFLVVIVQ